MAGVNKNPLGSVNRDSTGLRYVRKGCTVRIFQHRGRVTKVRTGLACVDWAGGAKGDWMRCDSLLVVPV